MIEQEFMFDTIRYKQLLLECLKFLKDYLDKNSLKWFVGYGACIGAVRHKGMIPWDDDIDILMPRKDYDILLSKKNELKKFGYELYSWHDGFSSIPFAKIINTHTSLWEIKYHPVVSGVFIDILPLESYDSTSSSNIKEQLTDYKKNILKYFCAMSEYTFKDMYYLAKTRQFHFFREGLLSFYYRGQRKRILNRLIKIDNSHKIDNGDKYVVYSASHIYPWYKEVLNKEWFDDYLLMPFEGIDVRIPVGYKEYLTHVYGNYMELPPEEKRVSRHYHYYVNLEERKTIEEIRIIKSKQ